MFNRQVSWCLVFNTIRLSRNELSVICTLSEVPLPSRSWSFHWLLLITQCEYFYFLGCIREILLCILFVCPMWSCTGEYIITVAKFMTIEIEHGYFFHPDFGIHIVWHISTSKSQFSVELWLAGYYLWSLNNMILEESHSCLKLLVLQDYVWTTHKCRLSLW